MTFRECRSAPFLYTFVKAKGSGVADLFLILGGSAVEDFAADPVKLRIAAKAGSKSGFGDGAPVTGSVKLAKAFDALLVAVIGDGHADLFVKEPAEVGLTEADILADGIKRIVGGIVLEEHRRFENRRVQHLFLDILIGPQVFVPGRNQQEADPGIEEIDLMRLAGNLAAEAADPFCLGDGELAQLDLVMVFLQQGRGDAGAAGSIHHRRTTHHYPHAKIRRAIDQDMELLRKEPEQRTGRQADLAPVDEVIAGAMGDKVELQLFVGVGNASAAWADVFEDHALVVGRYGQDGSGHEAARNKRIMARPQPPAA